MVDLSWQQLIAAVVVIICGAYIIVNAFRGL